MPKKQKMINGLTRKDNKGPYTYQFNFKGKTYKGTTDCYDLESAKKWLLKYKTELSLNNIDLKANSSVMKISHVLKEWVKYAKVRKLSSLYIYNLVARINNHVIPIIGDKLVRQLNNADMKTIVSAYMDNERPGRWKHIKRTAGGCNNLLCHLSGLITFAEEQDYIVKRPKFPFLEEQEKEKKIIPSASLPAFFKALDDMKEAHFSLIVRFCILNGLRESEARSMKWSQIDLYNKTFKLDKQKNKAFSGGLDLAPSMIPIIISMKKKTEENNVQSLFLFPSDTKTGYRSRNYLVALLNKLTIQVMGYKMSTHALRRSFITNILIAGVDPFTVGTLARHKDPKTTRRYFVPQQEAKKAAIDLIDKLATGS